VFGVVFSMVGLLPSIASVLALTIPYGGPTSMIWSVCHAISLSLSVLIVSQWAVGSVFILFVGMALGELASAASTSGGVSVTCTEAMMLPDRRVVALLLDILAGLSPLP
jgi:amino acid transporter